MQQGHCRPDRPPFQFFVLEGHPLVLIINRYRQLALGHVEQNAKHPFLLELFVAERLAVGAIAMPQLPVAVEGPAEGVVAESRLEVEVPILTHADLQFVLGAGVRNDLPVVDPLVEALVGDDRPE